jgi:glycosyltransferase involved in cell wall biosynthesis
MQVTISNGLKNFHLAGAAAEASSHGTLDRFFTGLYPTETLTRVLEFLSLDRFQRYARLRDRRASIDDKSVTMFVIADALHDAGLQLSAHPISQKVGDNLERFAMQTFAASASRTLRNSNLGGIYHYRSGYGLSSLKPAKARNKVLLCDHSIVHPHLLHHLIASKGNLSSYTGPTPLSGIWDLVLSDVEAADHVLVNSTFVKETFVRAGHDPGKISVIYLGVDDAFLSARPRRAPNSSSRLRLLFAGSFSTRKGAETLSNAMAMLPNEGWHLNIAGPVETGQRDNLTSLCQRRNVRYLGTLTRRQLASVMAETDVLVFPSFAEGSARVIFEALASGCYVITTPNSGSIVENGVHGALILPNDPSALASEIEWCLENPRDVESIRNQNADLVRRDYTQNVYGASLHALYRSLVDQA